MTDMANYDAMNLIWSEFFPKAPPARGILGVYRLPGDALVEVNAVAFRDLSRRTVLVPPGYPSGPASPGVIAGDKVYVSACLGVDLAGKVPDDPPAQVELAFDHMKKILAVAGLDFRHMVFINPYQTNKVSGVMNKIYASHFEFGNTPARATITATSLPLGANIEFTGVGVRDLEKRRAVMPKNMRPSPTASPCVFGGDTFYCSAKSAFIPGPNAGVFVPTVEMQVRMSMRNLLDGLEEAGLKFSNIVATNVFLDDIEDFAKMNRVYALYFPDPKPTRTTVGQIAPGGAARAARGGRGPAREDVYPELEQISLIAVQ
jgi:enamine deaminase RidA (YjgF/YER057c/UK114 family)